MGFSEGQRIADDTLKEPGIEEKDTVEVHQELTCVGGVIQLFSFPLPLNCIFTVENSLFVMLYSKWNSKLALYTSGPLNFRVEY